MTKRQANVTAPNPLIVQDMPQMCKFVYDFYANKVASMAEIAAAAAAKKLPMEPDEKIKATKPEGRLGQHPGEDRDSDDDMEDKKPQEFPQIVNEVNEEN